MRCFLAVWPSPDVLDALEAVERPVVPGLRWTTRAQWHVTLRFLGDLDAGEVGDLVEVLTGALAGARSMTATAGPTTTELAAQLVVPVAGLDDLAATVIDASRPWGDEPERRRFRGHLTLARARRGGSIPLELVRRPVTAAWRVDSVAVVRSHLEPGGARYEDLARIRLA